MACTRGEDGAADAGARVRCLGGLASSWRFPDVTGGFELGGLNVVALGGDGGGATGAIGASVGAFFCSAISFSIN